MTHQAPIPPGDPLDRAREPRPGDRWTAEKMAQFLRQLSATHSVSAAARSVGMSRQSAYRLRSRLKDQAFDLAWDVAFQHSYNNLAHAALERALNGVEVPIYYHGEQVGSYHRFDERLTVALLGMSTMRGNVSVLGRHASDAERHAVRFEALVAEVESGQGEDARIEDPGPAPPGEIERNWSTSLSPRSDGEIMAQLRALHRSGAG